MKFARVAVPAPLSPVDLLLDYKIPDDLQPHVLPGCLVEIPLGKRKSWGLVFELSDQSSFAATKLKSVLGLKLPLPVFDAPKLQFLRWLSRHYFFPIGEVCETALPTSIRKGTKRTLALKEFANNPALENVALNFVRSEVDLNAEQAPAVRRISEAGAGTQLLWGVTGSGKTEVYLAAIAERLSRGYSALVLVPEIALTPQLTTRFEKRFPNLVAVFHSGLKDTALRKAWLETWQGQKRIVIGPRSSLFAPLVNLGLIVVDEEHDGSYKQEERLKYHARDAAIRLGQFYKIPVVLGSATPSAETLHECTTPSILSQRAVPDAKMPELEIVDLKLSLATENKTPYGDAVAAATFQAPQTHGEFFLSPPLRAALQAALDAEKQSILFLNRRGLGSQELCRHCGCGLKCANCSVNLTPHNNVLLCHYCGFEQTSPKKCPDCGGASTPFIRVGVGTEAIENSLKLHFPKARLLRLDKDTASNATDLHKILADFRDGHADVLVGTQMVAKGHDFPQVTLVGILLAEMGLSVPDFRAAERNLQLLLQVSGRAGRALHPGRVILQTFQPEHPVFQTLLKTAGLSDYGDFISEELRSREKLLYPPFGKLALLRLDGLIEEEVEKAARLVGSGLKKLSGNRLQVLGPVVSPIPRIRARYRWQLLLKADSHATLHTALEWMHKGWVQGKLESKYKSRLTIDVDPVQML